MSKIPLVSSERRSYTRKNISEEDKQIHDVFKDIKSGIPRLLEAENLHQFKTRCEELKKIFKPYSWATFPDLIEDKVFEVQFGYTWTGYINEGNWRTIIKLITFTVYHSGEARYTIASPTIPTWVGFNNTRLYPAEKRAKGLYRLRDRLIKDKVYFRFKNAI